MRCLRFATFAGAAAVATLPKLPITSSPLSPPSVAATPYYAALASTSHNSLLQSRRYLFGFSSTSGSATAGGAAKGEVATEKQDAGAAAASTKAEETKEYIKNRDGLMPEPAAEDGAPKVNRGKFVDVFLYDTINDYVNGKISSPKFVVYVMKTTLRAITKNLEAEFEQYRRDTEKIIVALQNEVERLRQRVRDLEARNRRLEKTAEGKELE